MLRSANLSLSAMVHLRELVDANRRCYRHFQDAAGRIDDPQLAAVLEEAGRINREAAEELAAFVETTHTTVGAGDVSWTRWWRHVANHLLGEQLHDVPGAVQQCYRQLTERYRQLMTECQGHPVHAILTRQLEQLMADQERLASLSSR